MNWYDSISSSHLLFECFLLKGEQVDIPAKTTLLEEGRKVKNLFLVVEGELVRDRLNSITGNHEIIGIKEYIQGVPLKHAVKTTRNTRLLKLPGAAFDKIYKTSYGKLAVAGYLLTSTQLFSSFE